MVPFTVETHELGLRLLQRYSFSLCDAMIVAAALLEQRTSLYSEDLQDDLQLDEGLRILNLYR